MQLLLATHESSLAHDTGPRHPERPGRIPAVLNGIRNSDLPVLEVAPEPAQRELITAVHDEQYVEEIQRFCAAGGGALDLDTYVGEASWDAALRSAAAGPLLVDHLRRGDGNLGYAAMRPPGHHATHDRAMGFCLFNNVAVTAAYLTSRGERVAIVDWDVHHGNGTQETFYAHPDVMYLSIHQAGIYPGTGSLADVGSREGVGTNLNISVPAGTGGEFYRAAITRLISPVVGQFKPDWLLVSSGYDAHDADPLAGLRLIADDYGAMAKQLAHRMPDARSIIFLEGGYDFAALEASAEATVRGWLSPGYEPSPVTRGSAAPSTFQRARQVWANYWDVD